MAIPDEWLFPETAEKACYVQRQMACHVVTEDAFNSLYSIAGMDVSNFLKDPQQMLYASCVVLSFKDARLIEKAVTAYKQSFPYVPGLLGFREAPALVDAFKKIKNTVQLIMVDGHGISHPRGLGIASHLGVLLDIPTIGVAKTVLVGKPQGVLSEEVGSSVPLQYKGKTIAQLIRSKKRAKPIIVSIGHKVSLHTAIDIVQCMLRGYKLPETTRQAHLAANECRVTTAISR